MSAQQGSSKQRSNHPRLLSSTKRAHNSEALWHVVARILGCFCEQVKQKDKNKKRNHMWQLYPFQEEFYDRVTQTTCKTVQGTLTYHGRIPSPVRKKNFVSDLIFPNQQLYYTPHRHCLAPQSGPSRGFTDLLLLTTPLYHFQRHSNLNLYFKWSLAFKSLWYWRRMPVLYWGSARLNTVSWWIDLPIIFFHRSLTPPLLGDCWLRWIGARGEHFPGLSRQWAWSELSVHVTADSFAVKSLHCEWPLREARPIEGMKVFLKEGMCNHLIFRLCQKRKKICSRLQEIYVWWWGRGWCEGYEKSSFSWVNMQTLNLQIRGKSSPELHPQEIHCL